MRWFLGRPVMALMIFLALLVVGLVAYSRIPVQLAPPGFVIPDITVYIPVEESTPTEVLERVTEPAEESFRTISGVLDVRSRSSSNGARIVVSHDGDVSGDAIYADLRDRMERLLPTLPEGSDRYNISRLNLETDLPIMQIAVTHDDTVKNPQGLLENVLKPRLEGVSGVAQVNVWGLIPRRVDIELDPDAVAAHGVDVMGLIQRLRGDNVVSSAGGVEEGETRQLVRLSSRFRDFDEVRAYPVRENLTLGEIAEVGFRHAVRDFLVRVDGQRSYSVQISQQAGANTVEVCRDLSRMLEVVMPRDPRFDGFTYHPYWSQGEIIEASVSGLKETCAWGGLLAVMILFLFIRQVKVTLIITMAIPTSLLLAALVLFFQGGTFNMLSIMGLTLAIGMLIDNAIVIAENIVRLRSEGLSPIEASYRGVREVGLAVILATSTTIAVFVPGLFIGGNAMLRVTLQELGLPICYSLIGSLLVAVVFVPLAIAWLAPGEVRSPRRSGQRGDGLIVRSGRRCEALYGVSLRWILRHRTVAFLIFLGFLYTGNVIREKSSDTVETRRESSFSYEVSAPRFTLREMDELMLEIQMVVKPHHEELGTAVSACWYGSESGTIAFFQEPGEQRTREDFTARLQEIVPEFAGVEISLRLESEDDTTRNALNVEFLGKDPRVLARILRAVSERLESVPGILDVTSASEEERREVVVDVLRERAQRFGVNPEQVNQLVSWALRGAPLPDFQLEGEDLPFWIQFKGSDIENIADLYSLDVYTREGTPISLTQIANFGTEQGLPSIRRKNGRVRDRLQVVYEKDVSSRALRQLVEAEFRKISPGEGYELVVRSPGDWEDLEDILGAFLMALILVGLILTVLFESLILPLPVLASLPFLTVGMYSMLALMGQSLSETAFIGVVILVGIVVNNAIVLVDCIHQTRLRCARSFLIAHACMKQAGLLDGASVAALLATTDREHVIDVASRRRLRPIVMTASTTIFGLLPLVLIPWQGEGIDYRPLAVVVLGGLTTATLATLFVVPHAYVVIDDLRARSRELWARAGAGLGRTNQERNEARFAPETFR